MKQILIKYFTPNLTELNFYSKTYTISLIVVFYYSKSMFVKMDFSMKEKKIKSCFQSFLYMIKMFLNQQIYTCKFAKSSGLLIFLLKKI